MTNHQVLTAARATLQTLDEQLRGTAATVPPGNASAQIGRACSVIRLADQHLAAALRQPVDRGAAA